MKEIYKPLIKLTGFFLLLSALVYAISQTEVHILHSYKWFFLCFFYLQTVLTTIFIQMGMNANKNNMAVFYFGAMIFRFFISVSAAFVLVYKGIDDKVLFALNFFVFYLLFIMFEIFPILTNLRPNLSSSEK